jgi:hypothetical protein
VSSNIGQNYPYTSETEARRAAAVEAAYSAREGLREKIAGQITPLGDVPADEQWWVWACPADGATGRLHVAGYAAERRALVVVCDGCGKTFLR